MEWWSVGVVVEKPKLDHSVTVFRDQTDSADAARFRLYRAAILVSVACATKR